MHICLQSPQSALCIKASTAFVKFPLLGLHEYPYICRKETKCLNVCMYLCMTLTGASQSLLHEIFVHVYVYKAIRGFMKTPFYRSFVQPIIGTRGL